MNYVEEGREATVCEVVLITFGLHLTTGSFKRAGGVRSLVHEPKLVVLDFFHEMFSQVG